MFLDELNISARGGTGGSGCVHFAARKYQPFGGPDGGDGGAGGNVILIGNRDLDSLDHLQHSRFIGGSGGAGEGNLRTGLRGTDSEMYVPAGTIAYKLPAGDEAGFIAASGERLTVAKGGRGGKGNPHFATGGRRAPKDAEAGKEGESGEFKLLYRIYAGTALIEPSGTDRALLPRLLDRELEAKHWHIYRSRPRWVRVVQDYRAYDVAYLSADLDNDGGLQIPFLSHLYWAQNIVINLLPLEELAQECWPNLHAALADAQLRHGRLITVLAAEQLFEPWRLEAEDGEVVEVECIKLATVDDSMAHFASQLTGGIVE